MRTPRAIREAYEAVRDGRIVKSDRCECCGWVEDVRVAPLRPFHHLGEYPDHWTDVVWLCLACLPGWRARGVPDLATSESISEDRPDA